MKLLGKFGIAVTVLAVAAGVMLAPGRAGAQTAKSKQPAKTATKPASKASGSVRPASSKASSKKKTTKRRTSTRQRRQTAPTNDRIREIQAALIRSGHLNGEPSGKWDAQSIAAMKSFQEANSLKPTGKFDAASLQKLGMGSETAGMAAPRPPLAGVESGTRQR